MKKKIILQVCTGMCYLYKQNPTIPHGHLIPNNIMITKANDIKVENNIFYIIPIKLLDFGLAAMKKYIALTTGYSTKC
jgi:serine/threonine protein kinase